jgi:outer membrane lipoprotein LolB
MEFWVRGLRAPGSEASLEYDVQRRPVKLVQSGWTVEYRAYVDDSESALPRKVFATRGAHRVRLFVERWTAE